MVDAAHRAGKGVFLDLVYNHMNDSPLTQIAADVYRNGDAWGDRISHEHPIVKEFFRQAVVHTWRTFGLDGFRFDDTKTILNNNGWDFLARVHNAVRASADAEGRAWPFCVAENDRLEPEALDVVGQVADHVQTAPPAVGHPTSQREVVEAIEDAQHVLALGSEV